MQAVEFNGTFGGYLKRMSGFFLIVMGISLVAAMIGFSIFKAVGLDPSIIFENDFLTALSMVEENPDELEAYFEGAFTEMDEPNALALIGLIGAIFLFVLLMLIALPFLLSWYYRTLMRYFADVSMLGRHRVRFDGRMGGLIKLFFIGIGVNILAGLAGAPFAALALLQVDVITLVVGIIAGAMQVVASAFVLHKWLEWGVPHLVVEESSEDFVYEGKFLQILKIYALYITPFYLVGAFSEAIHEVLSAIMLFVIIVAGPFLIRLFTRQILGLITYGGRPLEFRARVKPLFALFGLLMLFVLMLIIVLIIPVLAQAWMLSVILFILAIILIDYWITYVLARWVIRGIHYEELPNKEEDLGLE